MSTPVTPVQAVLMLAHAAIKNVPLGATLNFDIAAAPAGKFWSVQSVEIIEHFETPAEPYTQDGNSAETITLMIGAAAHIEEDSYEMLVSFAPGNNIGTRIRMLRAGNELTASPAELDGEVLAARAENTGSALEGGHANDYVKFVATVIPHPVA